MNPDTRHQSARENGQPAPASDPATAVIPVAEFAVDLKLPGRVGFADAFLELRFRDGEGVDVAELARSGIIAFLSKTTQVDEYYLINRAAQDVEPGQYRIRQEGSSRPIVTCKTHGADDTSPSETIDNVNPHDDTISFLRTHGQLLAVIEKDRTTYKSRKIPNCLLHQDEVRGIGNFIDIKADSIEARDAFVRQTGFAGQSPIAQSYREMKSEIGIDPAQLKVWKFHERFKGYITGVVSGTLTPLGFLTATVASNQPRSAVLLALFSAGVCDGLSDAVANSQSTQSGSRASRVEQVQAFCRMMAGKITIPMTFVPIAVLAPSNTALMVCSLSWAALLLAGTASVQAIANERPVSKAVAETLAWGAGATGIATILGKVIPKLFGS